MSRHHEQIFNWRTCPYWNETSESRTHAGNGNGLCNQQRHHHDVMCGYSDPMSRHHEQIYNINWQWFFKLLTMKWADIVSRHNTHESLLAPHVLVPYHALTVTLCRRRTMKVPAVVLRLPLPFPGGTDNPDSHPTVGSIEWADIMSRLKLYYGTFFLMFAFDNEQTYEQTFLHNWAALNPVYWKHPPGQNRCRCLF